MPDAERIMAKMPNKPASCLPDVEILKLNINNNKTKKLYFRYLAISAYKTHFGRWTILPSAYTIVALN
jgi:hypothetical protein